MAKSLQFTLETSDAMQLLDGLKARAEEWDKTAEIMETGYAADDHYFALECESPKEAKQIGQHYRDLVVNIERQIATQIA